MITYFLILGASLGYSLMITHCTSHHLTHSIPSSRAESSCFQTIAFGLLYSAIRSTRARQYWMLDTWGMGWKYLISSTHSLGTPPCHVNRSHYLSFMGNRGNPQNTSNGVFAMLFSPICICFQFNIVTPYFSDALQNPRANAHEPVTPASRLWSWRKSSTLTATWPAAGALRSPIASASTNGRLKSGSKTDGWSGRKTQGWKWRTTRYNVFMRHCSCCLNQLGIINANIDV